MHSILNILKYPILNPHSLCSARFLITGTSGVVGSPGKVDLFSYISEDHTSSQRDVFQAHIKKKFDPCRLKIGK